MTSGKLTPKPDDTHRKALTKRTMDHLALINKMTPDRFLKSPSQKKSESAKKREARRAEAHEASCSKAAAGLVFDCYTCPKNPCGTDPVACGEKMHLGRCGVCGKPVRYYYDVVKPWSTCEDCRKIYVEPAIINNGVYDEEADEEFDKMMNDRDDWEMKGYQR